MWRLKIGKGGNNPYLFSTNNYLGRQTWEFDPNAGTPEERAEVEETRINFYNNRFKVQGSSDLLWQMQVILILYSLQSIAKKFSVTFTVNRTRMEVGDYMQGS